MCRQASISFLVPLIAGCSGVQSMLDPAGPGAEAVAQLWWVMLSGAAIVLILVMLLALLAVYRHPDRRNGINAERWIVAGGVALPGVALTALLLYGFDAGSPLQVTTDADPLRVEVTGHRWWWEVRYPGTAPAVTANEIHIPVGRPVQLVLRSADVIHSFWVPRLAGKADLIPGRVNTLWLRADEPGAFRGQCAEFCGAQHTHMAFWVIAEPPHRFEAWLERQRQPARAPASEAERRGREQFLSQRCVECHTLRGTPADGDVGPDLTHVGSRRTIAAGTLSTGRETIARWIAANQHIKPGNLMLSFAHLEEETIYAIATYLESLE